MASTQFCNVEDVCGCFPQFKRAQDNSVSDETIESWINQRKARIRSVLLTRGYDPDVLGFLGDAHNFLRGIHLDLVVADLADTLQGTLSLQPSEYSLAAARRKSAEGLLKELADGMHDLLFMPDAARTVVTGALFGGIGGAETDRETTPRQRGENRRFGMNHKF